ncbi:glycosyltransferase family 2 protein [Salinibacter ruber]|uniref:glycosyltransferase family 2 protein n=1 Tax=Salinibacter ruber TaxID=146919 RepID=UPI00207494E0|nr:glycosyltransferase family A protein [Salinibacter ruber]
MKKRVSVCIPTCNRPDYFEKTLRSVLGQTLGPFEILVGDDSSDEDTTEVVQQHKEDGAPIQYFHNEPSFGQARNVDHLFQKAEGDFIVLLHDDDLLLPGALETLISCFATHSDVVAAFGKQQIINADGHVKTETTHGINEGYYRTAEHEGRQSSNLRSAIVQQFPNDGYMVRADAAKAVGYDHPGAGDACDFAFGVELARTTQGDFYYTDAYVSQYRHSEESIVRGEEVADTAYRAFKIVTEQFSNEVESDPYVKKWLRERAPVAIMMAAQNGFPRDGFRWFVSRYHRPRILSPGGIRRFLALLKALW